MSVIFSGNGLNHGAREGGIPYNGLYGEAPPERGTLFRLEVYKRVGILRVELKGTFKISPTDALRG